MPTEASFAARPLAALIVGAVLSSAAFAQSPPAPAAASAEKQQRVTDVGKREFNANCASCHGTDGKGKGPVADLLRRSPPDLTQLAKSNNGILPVNRLYESIEGGKVGAHGSRDMPIWGMDYRMRDAEYYGELPYDSEAMVRARILSLVEYISRLQAR